MYIFGGKDDDNNKLSDTWRFSFKTNSWEQIISVDEPLARSGHASAVYKDYMIIYGGIYIVTKELNDMHVFDLKANKWLCLFEELNSPMKPTINQAGSPNSVGVKKAITL